MTITTMKEITDIVNVVTLAVLTKVEILKSAVGTKDPMKQEFLKGEAKGAMDALVSLELISRKQYEYFLTVLKGNNLHFDKKNLMSISSMA